MRLVEVITDPTAGIAMPEPLGEGKPLAKPVNEPLARTDGKAASLVCRA